MNVYDFDKTICKDDTESDFVKYCLIHHPINLFKIPSLIIVYFKLKRNKLSQEDYRNKSYLSFKFKDINSTVNKFWEKRKKKILKWYLAQKRDDDLIISVTPDFLLLPIFKELNIKNYICSKVDLNNRKVIGKMIYGEEKKRLFLEKYTVDDLDAFYTDSLTDLPMLKLAKKSYLVDKKYKIHLFEK